MASLVFYHIIRYADDLVIVAKSEREMKEMIKGLGKYVRMKKLEVNVEKTKMMVFNKRKRKSEENVWNWEGRKTERVNEFKYLGYTFSESATDKAHTREIVKKANKVMGCVWGIGKRKWRGDFRRRMMMMFERNARLRSERRVQVAESEREKESGKV
jgi:hypothetical protein